MAKPKKTAKKPTTKAAANPVSKSVQSSAKRFKAYMSRRPHRSFQMTKRRDYKRSLKMPGYWSFTLFVWKTLRANWKLFGSLALVYVAAIIIVTGADLQQIYTGLKDLMNSSSADLFAGAAGEVQKAGLLLLATATTSLSPDMTKPQSLLAGLAFFFAWLATIWLMRNVLAGHQPRLRDGLYNSGAPVLATVTVGFIIMLQFLPAAIASIVYSAATTSGLIEGGVSGMLVWVSIILLTLLTIYWVTSSLIALVIVTLPGMYPMRAIRAAGDLVVGRRLRILFRLLWLGLIIAVIWAILIIPVILFDNWLKQAVSSFIWLPLVPLATMLLGAATLIFATSYIYLLYRRIVDDDAAPA